MTILLKGIAWDHPRGYGPLKALSKAFNKINPEVEVIWDVRTLKEFGDLPIKDLVDNYDLITIDHPYMGQAHKDQLLLSLEHYIPHAFLEEQRCQSVGPSFDSYYYQDHVYALPIDAAALVAAYRKEMFAEFGLSLPGTHHQLRGFYKKLPPGNFVAWPLCATDLWCSFLTLCAQNVGPNFTIEHLINDSIGSTALDLIKDHLKFIHPDSIHWNPIQVLDKMGEDDEIVYSPYLFGYSNYARKGYKKNLVHFSNSPCNPNHAISTILGGVGLAVSAQCRYIAAAVEYVKYVAGAEIQTTTYAKNDGQPANLKAWKDKKINEMCNDFFLNTLRTMEQAYVRPRYPGWNDFQEKGAALLHKGIQKDTASDILMSKLNQLYHSIFYNGKFF